MNNTMEFKIASPLDEVLSLMLKKYGPITVPQRDLDGFRGKSVRITLQEGAAHDDPDAEVTIELVEA